MSPQQSGANDPDTEVTGTAESSEAIAGTVIGPYHMLQSIGHGGMGEVWLAEQKHPVRRRVAIKLIKAGMETREVVARFEAERQALALMDHPAIAKVFDAGSTAQGRPYFVMEYVTGVRSGLCRR
jgi:serine/threonine protein kinase